MFERLHKRIKGKGSWCDTVSKKVVKTYNESTKTADGVGADSEADVDGVGVDSTSDIPFNPKAWENAIAGLDNWDNGNRWHNYLRVVGC
uniref:Reverse transcriptase domain, reverse transcriptase zinc-binding domain protein n=1 Tax=Tanacetum cinerariifolium TaxID=118510 RepID=A0A6L2JXA6_TANCI|nr:reverse transcriptase domain, reverse transcriptase zinc-binding domain protein [Tanacetum cinerariifolium]